MAGPMRTMTLYIQKRTIRIIDELVRRKVYQNRSEFMRMAMNHYLKEALSFDVWLKELDEDIPKETVNVLFEYTDDLGRPRIQLEGVF